MLDIESVWGRIVAHEGETFHQVSGNPFTYRVVGKAIVPDRTPRQIPKSNLEKALALLPFKSTGDLQHLQGPSFIYALLTDPRIVPGSSAKTSGTGSKGTPKTTTAAPTNPVQLTPLPCLSSGSMSVLGYSFVLVGPLEPERDDSGAIKKLMPQGKYAKNATAALNSYGQGPFCRFRIPRNLPHRGVYAVVVGGEVMYIGKCANLTARFNTMHGQVSPKNCYEGGQNTTCKINRLVLREVEKGQTVTLWFHQTQEHTAVEDQLINALDPAWNGTVKL